MKLNGYTVNSAFDWDCGTVPGKMGLTVHEYMVSKSRRIVFLVWSHFSSFYFQALTQIPTNDAFIARSTQWALRIYMME